MEKILYRTTLNRWIDNFNTNILFDKNLIESQLKLPIFQRKLLFSIFDKDGKINDNFLNDLYITKPFDGVFNPDRLRKIGYDIDCYIIKCPE